MEAKEAMETNDANAASKEKKQVVPETPDPQDLVTKATAAAIRLEEANKEMAKLLQQQAAMKAEKILGGKTEAGSKQTSKEEQEIANARKMLEGTGYDKDLFPKEKV